MEAAFLLFLARLSLGAVIYVDADAPGANDGSSWTDAYTDLQDALSGAASGDEIWVAEGTYLPSVESEPGEPRTETFALVWNVALYGGFAGTESARDERDWETHVTVLSGDIGIVGDSTDNSYHVVIGVGSATLDGFEVTDGNANGSWVSYGVCYGAGMYNDSGWNITVANCVFLNNSASYYGGGIYFDRSCGFGLSVTSCSFYDNAARRGGGMYNDECSLPITGCTFSNNTATQSGGGLYNFGSFAVPSITNTTFSGNNASDAYGGGGAMRNEGVTSLTIAGCQFVGNTSEGNGGALHSTTPGTSTDTIIDCTFSGNLAAGRGGAVWNSGLGVEDTVANCTFYRNVAGDSGGGMYNSNSYFPLTNCTFSGNTAGNEGGAVYAICASPNLKNCILWGDFAPAGPEIYETDHAGHDCTARYSDIGQTGGYLDNGGNINADPFFVDAGNGDLHLRAGSPCIDAAWGSVDAPNTDIEGNARWDDPGMNNDGVGTPTFVDMGAYEFQGVTPTGTVAGVVTLEEGANPDEVAISATAGRQIASKTLVGSTIEYTINNVPLSATQVRVLTAEVGYHVVGSPAAISWAGTDGSAAATTVCLLRGTVTGKVTLEDGADAALVTITAGGETASKAVIGGTINYTITSVPVLTTEVQISTAETDYEVVGSPAAITWNDTSGSAPDATVRYSIRGTVTGTVILEDAADPGLVTITSGGKTGAKALVSDTIEYTIVDVAVITTEVEVTTAQPGYAVTGSPAPITWAGSDGSAPDTTVYLLRGTVTGTVALQDGADPALVTITVDGQSPSTNVIGDSIEYTITGIPVLVTDVSVVSTEEGYEVLGSPAAITWIGTAGAAAEVTVRKVPVSGGGGGGCGAGAALAFCILIPYLALRRRERLRG